MTQVTQFQFGLVHAPLTPFIDGKLDLATFEKLIRFHVAAGADALAIQTHAGESVSLPVDERKKLLELAIATAGTTPIIANVSEAGTGIACDLARHARLAGAKAMIACVPYYWTPPDAMLVEHFAAIAEAGELPLFLYNSPHEMNNVKIKTPVAMALVGRSTFIAGQAHRVQLPADLGHGIYDFRPCDRRHRPAVAGCQYRPRADPTSLRFVRAGALS